MPPKGQNVKYLQVLNLVIITLVSCICFRTKYNLVPRFLVIGIEIGFTYR